MTQIDLSGEWSLTCQSEGLELSASVPGDTLSALLKAGRCRDPYAGVNENELRWLGQADWCYTREFEVDDALLKETSVRLFCDGVDTLAEIRINGVSIGRTANMFRSYEFEIKSALRPGSNRITVLLAAPEPAGDAEAKALPYSVPHLNFPVQSAHRNLLRKVQCHAGWDWGPCLMVAGLYGRMEVQGSSDVRIAYVMSETAFEDSHADVKVTVEADAVCAGELPLEIRLGDALVRETVTLVEGVNQISRTLRIESPKRWWPNGYGEQHRYDLRVALGTAVSAKKIGLRSIELVNQEDSTGLSMAFRVNGVDLFCKGANWIPADSMPERQTPAVYEDLLQSAVDANMNMLRVWGGGQYEQDIFYDLCDAKGLLVWQDFMFACSLYPATPAFLENVREEVVHQIKRLRDYACIALWCGNNENLAALNWFKESKESRDRYLVDYDRLYEGVIGAAVDAHDPTRTYWPCSPCGGRGDYSDCFHDDSRGDMHYWDVWHEGKSFSAYYQKVPRFCSEFGYQSFPSMDVVRQYATEDQFNVTAPVMEHHQRNPGGNSKIIEMFSRYFRMPSGFGNFVYLSQVQQGVAIRTAVEFWRSLRPVCMGTLFWQLNDCWPVCSWASLNYGGKWKILHYMAKRFYAPVIATTFQRESGQPVEIWGVNDRLEIRSGSLRVRLIDFKGDILWQDERAIELPENSSVKLVEYPLESLPAAPHEAFLLTELSTEEGTCRSEHFLTEYKRCDLAAPNIRHASREMDDGFAVTLSSDRPAFFVTVDAEGIPGEFDDNAFTLTGGESRTLHFRPKIKTTAEAFTRSLRVSHLQGVEEAV